MKSLYWTTQARREFEISATGPVNEVNQIYCLDVEAYATRCGKAAVTVAIFRDFLNDRFKQVV